jgi:hypothetical protein
LPQDVCLADLGWKWTQEECEERQSMLVVADVLNNKNTQAIAWSSLAYVIHSRRDVVISRSEASSRLFMALLMSAHLQELLSEVVKGSS